MGSNNIHIIDKVREFSPLPLRIIIGITFIIHGLPKLVGVGKTQGFFGHMGLPPELALPIALLEVIGGIVLICGILTRITSILLIIEMIGAIFTAKISKGFVGGYELDLLLIFIAMSLLISGPGRISIERDILKREIFPKTKY
ncbi:MAG TPA: DoxX family protein [Verrucomicrobiae bacterium]|nr:DoxX family protein [Verrucomicrobiae bacterium]